ncbi:MAG: hypothetical protein DRO94_00680 [Candidatus Altiarchaeales archaeon]|nr:MAG: hypothetical protein DRO94_00680 [Candidatus Altiarchaeales archaeon]
MTLLDYLKKIIREISYLIHDKEIVFGAYIITHIGNREELIRNLKRIGEDYGAHIIIQSIDIHSELNNINTVLNSPFIISKIPDIILERVENLQRIVEEGHGTDVHAFHISLAFDRKYVDEGLVDEDVIREMVSDAREILENDIEHLYLSFD